jgi:hypothetical protein
MLLQLLVGFGQKAAPMGSALPDVVIQRLRFSLKHMDPYYYLR